MWGTLRHLTLNILPKSLQKTPRLLESLPILFENVQRQLSSSSSFRILGGPGQHSSLLQPWMNRSLIPVGSSDCPIVSGGYTIPSRGMKVKGRVKRRCKDCYLIWKEGILHNLCKTHPRHKQMLKPVYFANSRILTHATSGFKRPW